MKKGQVSGGMMIAIMIVVIFSMVAIQVSWSLIRTQLDTTAITDDPFVVANTSCVRITDLCFTKGTLTVESNYAHDSTGNFTECGIGNDLYGALANMVDANFTDGETINSSYTEESCTPITGMTATLINYLPILMAIVILAFIGGYAMMRK